MHGLLWSAVTRDEVSLPAGIERELAIIDLGVRAHHRHLSSTLEEVTARLTVEEIDVASLKGVTAEARWYDRVGDRPSGDLDLWISPYQLNRIDDVVGLLDPGHFLAGEVGRYAAEGYVQSIDLVVDGIAVDIHVDPIKLGFDFRQARHLWETAEWLGSQRVMSVVGSTLIAAMHLLKDGFATVGQVEEFTRLMQRVHKEDLWRLAWDEGLESWVTFVIERAAKLLRIDMRPDLESTNLVSLLGAMAFPVGRSLGGPQHLDRGARAWRVVPYTVPGRFSDALQGEVRKLHTPAKLADYNLKLLKGSRLFRAVRRAQLVRAAKDRRRST